MRVQESAFECQIDAGLAGQMRSRLDENIDKESDSVMLFVLCDACAARVECRGVARPAQDQEWYVV